MLYRLAITQMKNGLLPSAVKTSVLIYPKYDLASAWLQDDEVNRTFVVCYVLLPFLSQRYRLIFQRSPLPVLQQNICRWKLKRLELYCLLNPISMQDCIIKSGFVLLCSVAQWISAFFCQTLFHSSFKNDVIKCSISKWATHYQRKIKAALATWTVVDKKEVLV